MGLKHMVWVHQKSLSEGDDRRVLEAIAAGADDQHSFYVTVHTLKDFLHLDKAQVKAALYSLIASGELKVGDKDRSGGTCYTMTLRPGAAPADAVERGRKKVKAAQFYRAKRLQEREEELVLEEKSKYLRTLK